MASETHTLPETTALEDVESNLIENKREYLSEGGQSADHAANDSSNDENHGDLIDDVNTPEHRDGDDLMENNQCTCGAAAPAV